MEVTCKIPVKSVTTGNIIGEITVSTASNGEILLDYGKNSPTNIESRLIINGAELMKAIKYASGV